MTNTKYVAFRMGFNNNSYGISEYINLLNSWFEKGYKVIKVDYVTFKDITELVYILEYCGGDE